MWGFARNFRFSIFDFRLGELRAAGPPGILLLEALWKMEGATQAGR
jgi:hypothetical protein